MRLLVSHMTALRYWRTANDLQVERAKLIDTRTIGNEVNSTQLAKSLKPEDYGLAMSDAYPLEALVSSRESRCRGKAFAPHMWSGPVPYGAFRELCDGILISSPEFVFLQLASKLDVIELARLGNELCGTYSLREGGRFVERAIPLTTRARLASFVRRASGARGVAKAREALACVANRSASPRETITLLALCLPKRLGGYALPLPQLNKKVEVSERLRPYVNGDWYRPDFLWVRYREGHRVRITAEYDSHECHDGEQDAERTRIRRNDFETMRIFTNSINKSQLKSGDAFIIVARQIARDLGLHRQAETSLDIERCNGLLRRLAHEHVF